MGEAHLSTEQPETVQEARLSSAYVHAGGPSDIEGPAGKGPRQTVGLIWTVRDRTSFSRLTTEGRRFRTDGPISLRFATSDVSPTLLSSPCVAFSISRSVGNAVQRNQLRRRLRDLFRQQAVVGLPVGSYLVLARVGAPDVPFCDLRGLVADLCRQVRESVSSP
jgi:ribonuclease P protein component